MPAHLTSCQMCGFLLCVGMSKKTQPLEKYAHASLLSVKKVVSLQRIENIISSRSLSQLLYIIIFYFFL